MTVNTATILLVDDEPEVRGALRDILERTGFTVLEAGNYYQGLEVLAAHPEPIDLLVTDVSLPGPNGCELANRMLEKRPGIKVLFISGYTGAEICVHYGIPLSDLHFMAKPLDPGAFRDRIRQILEEDSKEWTYVKPAASSSFKRPKRV